MRRRPLRVQRGALRSACSEAASPIVTHSARGACSAAWSTSSARRQMSGRQQQQAEQQQAWSVAEHLGAGCFHHDTTTRRASGAHARRAHPVDRSTQAAAVRVRRAPGPLISSRERSQSAMQKLAPAATRPHPATAAARPQSPPRATSRPAGGASSGAMPLRRVRTHRQARVQCKWQAEQTAGPPVRCPVRRARLLTPADWAGICILSSSNEVSYHPKKEHPRSACARARQIDTAACGVSDRQTDAAARPSRARPRRRTLSAMPHGTMCAK